MLVSYFARFASKSVCVSDLKLFLPSLTNEEKDEFSQSIRQAVKLDEQGAPSTVRT